MRDVVPSLQVGGHGGGVAKRSRDALGIELPDAQQEDEAVLDEHRTRLQVSASLLIAELIASDCRAYSI